MATLSKRLINEAMKVSRKAVDEAIDEVYSDKKYYWDRIYMKASLDKYEEALRGLLAISKGA